MNERQKEAQTNLRNTLTEFYDDLNGLPVTLANATSTIKVSRMRKELETAIDQVESLAIVLNSAYDEICEE